MQIKIEPSLPKGNIAAPPSKSMAHRLLICSALAEGKSTVCGVAKSEDILATVDCLRALGATIEQIDDSFVVTGLNRTEQREIPSLPCRESGSTLRFLIPLALSLQKRIRFCGSKRLMERPQDVYERLAAENGWDFQKEEGTITLCGALKSGEYHVAGNISSQFISGLLFVLPLLDGDSRLCIEGDLESKGYVDMTLQAMRQFGVEVEWERDYVVGIKGNQRYRSCEVFVEGDYSNAAFLSALNLMGGEVSVSGLSPKSLQVDRVFADCFSKLQVGTPTISLAQCPDLGPILFAMAAAQHGATFTDTKRLAIKESDRVATMVQELEKFGTQFYIDEDTVTVIADEFHAPKQALEGHNDHRVVMALSVLLTKTGGTINGAEAVNKSYPNFFSDLKKLEVKVCNASDK